MSQSRPPAGHSWRLPFKGMTEPAWQKLAASGIALVYLLLFAAELAWHPVCDQLGSDFCAFWTAAQVANRYGYAAINNQTLLAQAQRPVIAETAEGGPLTSIPFPYPPAFVLPFQAFALFRPAPGYWIWAILNLGGLAWYLRFFARKTTGEPLAWRLLAVLMLSWPVYLNFVSGQLNVVLAIAMGEFMRASLARKPYLAGVWLGGLLVKPQFLLLIGLVLLLRRAWRILAGLAAVTAVVGGISVWLVGRDGLLQLLDLWSLFARGQQGAIAQGVMMNWRMVGLSLSALTSPAIGWSMAIVGMVLTLVAALYLWRKEVRAQSPLFPSAMLGTLAATALLAWHSHYTSAVILLAPLILLSQPENRLPRYTLIAWALFPTLLYLSALGVGPLLLWLIPRGAESLPAFLTSGIFLSAWGIFGLNIYFLAWSVVRSRHLIAGQVVAGNQHPDGASPSP